MTSECASLSMRAMSPDEYMKTKPSTDRRDVGKTERKKKTSGTVKCDNDKLVNTSLSFSKGPDHQQQPCMGCLVTNTRPT